jgi:hypothetical protein
LGEGISEIFYGEYLDKELFNTAISIPDIILLVKTQGGNNQFGRRYTI